VAAPPPLPGSLLPHNRIIAYYGNPMSKRMGILGEIAPDSMLARLEGEVRAYASADSTTPALPALDLIVVVAQASAGADGKYRMRMSDSMIDRVASWADRVHGILILDVQPGRSTVAAEVAPFLKYLARPNVHLALDPEFSMPGNELPGKAIGTMSAAAINQTVATLAKLVDDNHIPPKVLIIHRFTRPMVKHASDITLDPRVQIIMDMDGFGPDWMKRDSYRAYVAGEPVQYTGIKLFYKNDKPILTPQETLALLPIPLLIMFQ
jgi:hypothetical protein